jgi:hypothetical protein
MVHLWHLFVLPDERRGWHALGEPLNPELGLAFAEYRIAFAEKDFAM